MQTKIQSQDPLHLEHQKDMLQASKASDPLHLEHQKDMLQASKASDPLHLVRPMHMFYQRGIVIEIQAPPPCTP